MGEPSIEVDLVFTSAIDDLSDRDRKLFQIELERGVRACNRGCKFNSDFEVVEEDTVRIWVADSGEAEALQFCVAETPLSFTVGDTTFATVD